MLNIVENPYDKVIKLMQNRKQKGNYTYEESVILIDFLLKSKFGQDYLNRMSSLHRLSNHVIYEQYEKGKTIYRNLDNVEHIYILLKGRVALLDCKNIEDMNYHRQRDNQFDYDRSISQMQGIQQAQQLKKRIELQSYDCFGYNINQQDHQNQQLNSQISDHIVLTLESTHVLILKAQIILDNNLHNHILNCKYLGSALKVEYTLLNDIICEQCFKKKGMFICQETDNPRFIYCVLFGSVLYQSQIDGNQNKNRVVLGQGALIGQTMNQEKQYLSKQYNQEIINQQQFQRQKTTYNGIQLANINNNDNNSQDNIEKILSTIHSSSEFTVLLMLDKSRLQEKLKDLKNQQNHGINYVLNSSMHVEKINVNDKNINNYNNNKIKQTRNLQGQIFESPQKGRLFLSKKTRSQSYSIVCKLIKKEQEQNSFTKINNQLVEFNPNYKKEYLDFNSTRYESNQQEQQQIKECKNSKINQIIHSSDNDYEDMIQRLTEKNAYPFNLSREYKYNKILMKNVRDKDQIARMIVESKKPINLNMYYNNPNNFVNKNSLMQQFHSKYLQHTIEEQKRNENSKSSKRFYTSENQDNIDQQQQIFKNKDQGEIEIENFIQKINSQLINDQSQQNLSASKKSIQTVKNTYVGSLSQEKLDHLTEIGQNKQNNNQFNNNVHDQTLFYPYRVQEMLDQYISLKNQQSSGQKEIESIQFRKSSAPSVNCQLQFQMNDPLFIQQQQQVNNNNKNNNNFNKNNYAYNNQIYNEQGQDDSSNENRLISHQCIQLSDQIIEEQYNHLNSLRKFKQNQNRQKVQDIIQSQSQEQLNNSYQDADQNHVIPSDEDAQQLVHKDNNNDILNQSLQREAILQYYSQNQLKQMENENNQSDSNEKNMIINNKNSVIRSQSVPSVLKQQLDCNQIPSLINPIYPNIKFRVSSKDTIKVNKIIKNNNNNNFFEENKPAQRFLQLTELRMKKKQESQLNKILSTECRNNSFLFSEQKILPSQNNTNIQFKTQLNSQKSSRRQSTKGRPFSSSNSSSNQINITSKQIILSQFNNWQEPKKVNTKCSSDSKPANRMIVFSSNDKKNQKVNLSQIKEITEVFNDQQNQPQSSNKIQIQKFID